MTYLIWGLCTLAGIGLGILGAGIWFAWYMTKDGGIWR